MHVNKIEEIFTTVFTNISESKFKCHHGRFDRVALKAIFITLNDSIKKEDSTGFFNSIDFLFSVLELAYRDIYYQNIDDGYDNWHHIGSLANIAMKNNKLDPYISKHNTRSEIIIINKLLSLTSLQPEIKHRFNILKHILTSYEELNLIYEELRDK